MSTLSLAAEKSNPVTTAALAEWLRESNYDNSWVRDRICALAQRHGTLIHALERQYLDPEDYEVAEAILAESQPEVDYDDPAWSDAVGDIEAFWELGADPDLLPLSCPEEEEVLEERLIELEAREMYLDALRRAAGLAPRHPAPVPDHGIDRYTRLHTIPTTQPDYRLDKLLA